MWINKDGSKKSMASHFWRIMYSAYYRPDDDLHRTKHGFATEAEAIEFIGTQICRHCKQQVEQGFAIYGDEKDEESIPVHDAMDTGCGAEWLIGKTEDFEKATDIEDIFEAGGWKRLEPPKDDIEPCKHDWKVKDVKDGNVIWQCSKCPLTFTDSGDGGDG